MSNSKDKNYYVYRITNVKENKHYYGYRGIPKNSQPKDDLGIKYFSSSMNKDFRKDQKINPQNFKYKIICKNLSKRNALNLEIKLHKKFNVSQNINFYNLANQTNTGFSYIGPYQKQNDKKAVVINKITGKRERIDVGYDQTIFTGNTTGTVKVKRGNITVRVSKEEFIQKKLEGTNKGRVVALNTLTNKKELISKELFDSSSNYVGHSTGYKASEQTRALMRVKSKGNRGGAGNKGKSKTPEHVANVIASRKRNKLLKEQAQLQNLQELS